MTEQIPKKHRFAVSSIIAWSVNYILVTLIGSFFFSYCVIYNLYSLLLG